MRAKLLRKEDWADPWARAVEYNGRGPSEAWQPTKGTPVFRKSTAWEVCQCSHEPNLAQGMCAIQCWKWRFFVGWRYILQWVEQKIMEFNYAHGGLAGGGAPGAHPSGRHTTGLRMGMYMQ